MGNLKGQMVFEFIVATILFIGIVFYVVFMLNTTMTSYTSDYYKNHLNEEAMRVSEMLVNSPGVWINGAPQFVGLSAAWPVLNDTKINYMNAFCAGFDNRSQLLSLLGLSSRGGAQSVWIVMVNSTQTIINCSAGAPYSEQAYAERFAYSNQNGLVKIGVNVW